MSSAACPRCSTEDNTAVHDGPCVVGYGLVDDDELLLSQWINEVRSEICECGCEVALHEIKGMTVVCPNCTVECAYLDEQ